MLRAESELKRREQLFEDSVISVSEFEDFKLEYEVAKTEFDEIAHRLQEIAFQIPGLIANLVDKRHKDKDGKNPTKDNRFLMKYGFEIYDEKDGMSSVICCGR